MLKKIAITVGVTMLATALFAKKTADKVTILANNVKLKIVKFNNVDFGINKITLNIDAALVNLTNIDFSLATGQTISLTKVELYTDTGIKIADAYKSIDNIQLTPFGTMPINNVQVIIPTNNLGDTVLNVLTNNPEKIIAKAHVTVLGKNYII